MELSDGEFTAEFLPGEVRIYKLEGDEIVIDEGLELPRISLESGTYTGAQTLRLSTGQKNVSLYYTLDGSYPEVSADGKPGEGTYLYEGEITLGETGKWEYIPFRAVSFKNGEVSRSVNRDFFITENSENVALGKPVSFYDRNFEREIGVRDEKSESATGAVLTDGYHDPYTEVFTKEAGETGWAVVDLGGAVIDVTVEHAVYGQICAPLHIFSRYDADAFNEKIQQSGSRPLSNLTGGIHLHTIRATDEKTLERVIQGLKDKGFLLLEDN